MSEIKGRRAPREAARMDIPSEAAAGQPVPVERPATSTAAVALAEAAAGPTPDAETVPEVSRPGVAAAAADDVWAGVADAQAAVAHGLEQFALELTGMTRTGIAAGTEAAIALLGARTFAEVVEINAGLARRGVDTMIEGSAKLAEIGVNTANEAARPLLSRLGASWNRPFAA